MSVLRAIRRQNERDGVVVPAKKAVKPDAEERRRKYQKASIEFRRLAGVPIEVPLAWIQDGLVWSALVPIDQAPTFDQYVVGTSRMIMEALGVAAFAKWSTQ